MAVCFSSKDFAVLIHVPSELKHQKSSSPASCPQLPFPSRPPFFCLLCRTRQCLPGHPGLELWGGESSAAVLAAVNCPGPLISSLLLTSGLVSVPA